MHILLLTHLLSLLPSPAFLVPPRIPTSFAILYETHPLVSGVLENQFLFITHAQRLRNWLCCTSKSLASYPQTSLDITLRNR